MDLWQTRFPRPSVKMKRQISGLYKRIRATRLHQLRLPALISAATTLGAYAFCAFNGIRINATSSLPVGLYVVTDSRAATLVEFCPVGDASRISMMRGYRHSGTCPDGGAPLIEISLKDFILLGCPMLYSPDSRRQSNAATSTLWPRILSCLSTRSKPRSQP